MRAPMPQVATSVLRVDDGPGLSHLPVDEHLGERADLREDRGAIARRGDDGLQPPAEVSEPATCEAPA